MIVLSLYCQTDIASLKYSCMDDIALSAYIAKDKEYQISSHFRKK